MGNVKKTRQNTVADAQKQCKYAENWISRSSVLKKSFAATLMVIFDVIMIYYFYSCSPPSVTGGFYWGDTFTHC